MHAPRYKTICLFFLLCFICFIGISSGTLFNDLSPRVQTLVEQLARLPDNDHREAKLWRHLGKIQFDAGEYAEACRIFCHGSERCPSDPELRHHVRVWTTFHGDIGEPPDELPARPVPRCLEAPADHDVFLSLEVPDGAVPDAVRKRQGDTTEQRRLIHASREPLLPPDACRFLIQAATDAAARRGWTLDRHVQAPACDIPVFDLSPGAQGWCREALRGVLLPLLASAVAPELEVDPAELRIQDCFVVRYDGSDAADDGPGFSSLNPHEDESLLSLTIALNNMDEYDGGGLFIKATGDLLNGNAGTVLCFPGGLVHGGYPVSRGTRWILTIFVYVDANESKKKPGYTLDAITQLGQTLVKPQNIDGSQQQK